MPLPHGRSGSGTSPRHHRIGIGSSTAPRFGARIRGSFVPDASGEWEVGAHAVGAATLRVDGEPLIDIPIGEHGGAFYGLGSREHRVRVDVEAGRSYAIEVDYPVVPDQLVRGLSFGARVVESGDPLERAAAAAAVGRRGGRCRRDQ